ncbi:TetR/AcrR family transcriptional regulator [Comamonas testosteroni]|uniref:TetR/AcrR family transcriptional regulator n=1 Tax=Comamonas testosteroni TaxID=285 RepID=UPI0023AAC71F|nr:TetR/AcrR family transcriptional regulator [Comamonas testosteroni]WEE75584.1 TetR/AcrR family transcriptional regulator [Comamonas testosteroni]
MNSENQSFAALPPRERILVAAHDLFYSEGIRATGVDRIIDRSSVSKVTFYRQYASKDELIRAYLDYRHQGWISWFKSSLAQESRDGASATEALLRTLSGWFSQAHFRGCAFLNAAAELGSTDPGILEVVRHHKKEMACVLDDLFNSHAFSVGQSLSLAVDGAIVHVQMGQPPEDVLGNLKVVVERIVAR